MSQTQVLSMSSTPVCDGPRYVGRAVEFAVKCVGRPPDLPRVEAKLGERLARQQVDFPRPALAEGGRLEYVARGVFHFEREGA